jgi:hypothetical protein
VRSYSSAHGGNGAQGGWEHLVSADLAGHAPRVAEEAVALLTAPTCLAGRATVGCGTSPMSGWLPPVTFWPRPSGGRRQHRPDPDKAGTNP